MSSTEAELLAFTHTARETIATQRLSKQLELQLDEDPVIECDNKQTIRLVNLDSPRIKTALKHVDVHNCWARQAYQEGHFKVTYTAEMLADGLTKALPGQRFDQFVKQLGLVDIRHLVEAPQDEVYNTD
ncbi:Copia protein [Tolypocladium ophioglossoides CBS 100239]|uniref:Copia protein n=1 Tax=Tolypocladium ophioglossoides (strain CBS 100239) TaxID=1163406 RepID=A0A0L0MXG1_TOLOC|nr:Copia protein [Tolypocladium ophioglossoides CBS 100239]